MKKLRPSEVVLWEARVRHEYARRRREQYFMERAAGSVAGWHPYVSSQLTLMSGLAQTPKPKKRTALLTVDVPEVFSLIDNPDESLRFVKSFAADIREKHPKGVRFNHARMNHADLAAECLLDAVATEMTREYASAGRPQPKHEGSYPRNPELVRFLKAIGIVKNLNVTHEFLRPSESSSLRVFHRRKRGGSARVRADTLDYKGAVLVDFVRHVNSCLTANGRQLTPRAVQRLLHYTGEILDNAEQHSGSDDWSIAGYLDNAKPGHKCEIAIYNFGKTIADTLDELPRDSYTWREIGPYVDEHSRRSLFAKQWTRENLLTLVALQGHVSRKTTGPTDNRGQGTVDLIEFFQAVHRECVKAGERAQMVIASGGTHVRFDGTHAMQPDQRGRKVIAFNEANSLAEKPDPQYVTNLAARFPGTLISIRFPLQESQTEKRVFPWQAQAED